MRKILSFVLVLSLILGSFSMAFAATPPSDIAASPNAEAITVGVNLGIIDGFPDGTYKPTQAVNRAEFAKLMTKALGIPDSALAGYANTTFKDVSGYQWAIPYLAFCQSKGIMIGDGNGNVRPGATITVNEAMTMLMRAVGYTENSAALVGTWPAKYVSLAKNNGMYDDVANAVTLDRANAAQVIYNALTVSKVEVSADGTTKVLAGNTMLTTGLDCYPEEITVTGTEDSLINLTPYKGKLVTVYKQKTKPNYIVAVASTESNGITGKIKNATTTTVQALQTITGAGVSGNLELTDSNDVVYTIFDTTVGAVIVNGEDIRTSATSFGPTDTVTINGTVVGKQIKEINSITIWETPVVLKLAVAGDIAAIKDNKTLGGSDFTTLKDGSIDLNSFELTGVSSLDKIAVDNVIYAYVNNKNVITKVEVGTTIVEGTVSKIVGASSTAKYTVDGKVYEFGHTVNGNKYAKAGNKVKLYLNADGEIAKCVVTSGSADKYGIHTNDDARGVALHTSDDNETWFSLTSNVKIADFGADYVLAGYALDKDGKIDYATTGNATNAAFNSGTLVDASVSSAKVVSIGGMTRTVASDATVYVVTGGGAGVINGVVGVSKMSNVQSGPVSASALLNDDGVIVAFAVLEGQAGRTAQDVYGVINELSETADADNKANQTVLGFVGKAEKLDKQTTSANTFNSTKTANAGLFKIQYDGDGLIKSAEAIVSSAGVVGITETVNGTAAAISDGDTVKLGSIDYPVDSKAVVYKVSADSKNNVVYTIGYASSIQAGDTVVMYEVDNTDKDSDGYDYIIYAQSKDAGKITWN